MALLYQQLFHVIHSLVEYSLLCLAFFYGFLQNLELETSYFRFYPIFIWFAVVCAEIFILFPLIGAKDVDKNKDEDNADNDNDKDKDNEDDNDDKREEYVWLRIETEKFGKKRALKVKLNKSAPLKVIIPKIKRIFEIKRIENWIIFVPNLGKQVDFKLSPRDYNFHDGQDLILWENRALPGGNPNDNDEPDEEIIYNWLEDIIPKEAESILEQLDDKNLLNVEQLLNLKGREMLRLFKSLKSNHNFSYGQVVGWKTKLRNLSKIESKESSSSQQPPQKSNGSTTNSSLNCDNANNSRSKPQPTTPHISGLTARSAPKQPKKPKPPATYPPSILAEKSDDDDDDLTLIGGSSSNSNPKSNTKTKPKARPRSSSLSSLSVIGNTSSSSSRANGRKRRKSTSNLHDRNDSRSGNRHNNGRNNNHNNGHQRSGGRQSMAPSPTPQPTILNDPLNASQQQLEKEWIIDKINSAFNRKLWGFCLDNSRFDDPFTFSNVSYASLKHTQIWSTNKVNICWLNAYFHRLLPAAAVPKYIVCGYSIRRKWSLYFSSRSRLSRCREVSVCVL